MQYLVKANFSNSFRRQVAFTDYITVRPYVHARKPYFDVDSINQLFSLDLIRGVGALKKLFYH